jgi:hypothetical protein
LTALRFRLGTTRAEIGSAVAALLLAAAVSLLLLFGGSLRLRPTSVGGAFVAIYLAPLLALVGVWLDVRQRQALGVMVLALAALLALDGVFATYLTGLPTFVAVGLSLAAAILRRKRSTSGDELP